MIFSGNAGENYAVDLEKYNRIHFGETGMKLVNSDNPDNSVEILYAAYHRFMVDDALVSTEINEIPDGDFRLTYNPSLQSLTIAGDGDCSYRIGVFDLNGTIVATSSLHSGCDLSVESLCSGVYVAVAAGNNSTKTLKFVKK